MDPIVQVFNRSIESLMRAKTYDQIIEICRVSLELFLIFFCRLEFHDKNLFFSCRTLITSI